MTTVIRQAIIDDKQAIWEFLMAAYGEFSRYKIPDRWIWEFLDNPLNDMSRKELPIFIAIKDGHIVGQLCAILGEMKIGDEIHPAVAGCDLIVLPECRGQGLAQALIQAVVEHYKIYLAISFAQSTKRIYYRMEPLRLDTIPTYIRFQHVSKESVVQFLMQKTANHPRIKSLTKLGCRLQAATIISTAANFMIAVRDLLKQQTKKKDRSEIKEVKRFENDINLLWDKINGKFKVILKRDKQFLNWRFSDIPQLDYRIFISKLDNVTKGYIVVRKPSPVEWNVGVIADLFADPDDTATIEDLINHAVCFFGKNVTMIECPTTRLEFQRALSKFGFLKIGTHTPISFCKDERLRSKLQEWKSSWHISKADEDWDQLHPK